MADGKLIKDLTVISKASDDCDLIIEDDSPKTMRIKLGDLKSYINQAVQEQITQINNDLSKLRTDLIYVSGDSWNPGNCYYSGILTTSSTQITFLIPLSCPIDGTPSIAINGSINIRGVNGYIVQAFSDFSNVTIDSFYATGIGIIVYLTKSDGWNGTNNTPINVQASFGITIS